MMRGPTLVALATAVAVLALPVPAGLRLLGAVSVGARGSVGRDRPGP